MQIIPCLLFVVLLVGVSFRGCARNGKPITRERACLCVYSLFMLITFLSGLVVRDGNLFEVDLNEIGCGKQTKCTYPINIARRSSLQIWCLVTFSK